MTRIEISHRLETKYLRIQELQFLYYNAKKIGAKDIAKQILNRIFKK